jgi:DNA ligase D-like protein (predicted 3'-phosphoesterase)
MPAPGKRERGAAGKDGAPRQGGPARQERGAAADDGGLEPYRAKRNLQRSGEPSGRGRGGSGRRHKPTFVVQQHDATAMHYDFRLEAGGVLKSWAVPKGPSLDPAVKRLAVPTEDHPLDYEKFEGVIPKGEYGAGPVIVWDTGTYENQTTDSSGHPVDVPEAIERGHVSFDLHGRKLRGGYSLTRLRSGREPAWLLVKKNDTFASRQTDPERDEPESVRSGKDIGDIGEGTS